MPTDTPLKAQSILGAPVGPPPTGVAFAGAASVNLVKDTTQASIVDAGQVSADSLAVTAIDDFFELSATGGAAFVAAERPGSKSLAGAFSFNDLQVDTRAFVLDSRVTTTGNLSIVAQRSGDLVSVAAGLAGAVGNDSISVAGSFALNMILNVTEAYLTGVVADVGGDVAVKASDSTRIIAVGGGIAFGGKAGAGLGVGANILGTDERPTITRAAITSSSLTVGGSAFEVSAANVNSASDPRIFALGAGVGIALGPDSAIGLGAMLSVNLTRNITEAYVKSSTVTEKAGTPGAQLGTTVKATDDSGIVAVAGAVGVSSSNAIGIAIGYNEIDNDVLAYLDDVDLTADGALTLEAASNGEIGGVAVGVAAAGGSSKISGAGSILINKITNTVEAYVADTVPDADSTIGRSAISVGGNISLTAADDSLIVSIAGGVSIAFDGAAVGAAVSYNLISNTVRTYVEDATVEARGSAASIVLSTTTTSTLVAIALGVAGTGGNLAIGGSLTVNAISNTLDAHIKNSTNVKAGDDVRVTALAADTLVVVAGGVGVSTGGSAAGAAIAYNFIGGSFDPANPDLIDRNSAATDQITAYVDNARVDAGGDIEVRAGYEPPTTPLPSRVSVAQETAVASAEIQFVRETGSDQTVFDRIERLDAADWGDTTLSPGQTITISNAGANNGDYVIDSIDGATIRLRDRHNSVTNTTAAAARIVIERGVVDLPADPSSSEDASTRLPFDARMVSVTVGAAVANDFALGGSISINVVAHDISAYINGPRLVEATGSILVSATDDVKATAVAGGIAVGQNAGGIAVALQIDKSKVDAHIGAGALIEARGNGSGLLARDGTKNGSGVPQTMLVKGLVVTATAFEVVRTVAIGLAGGARFGVAGSGGVTVMDRHVHASIDENANVNRGATGESTDQSVVVLASDRTDHVGVAGSVALGGIAGVGAGIEVGVLTKDTQAWIAAGAAVSAQRDVRVLANAQETVVSVAAAGAGGLTAGIAGAADVYVLTLTTKAFVEGAKTVGTTAYAGATVTAEGTVQVAAESRTEVDFISGNLAVGGTAGIGGAVVVPVITKDTYAFIGAGATVDGKAKKAGLDVRDGTFAVTFPAYGSDPNQVTPAPLTDDDVGYDPGDPDAQDPLVDEQLTGRRVATPGNHTAFTGVAVTAINQDDIGAFGIGASASGTVAIQISAAVHVMNADVHAYIAADAKVNQGDDAEGAGQSVLVAAANDYQHLGVAGGLAGSGVVGITPGVDISVVTNTVWAYIGEGALVDAKRDVEVHASSAEDVLGISIAIAASGLVGIGGAVTVLVVDNETHAYIDDDAEVRAGGNVVVTAADDTDVDVIAIGAGIGIGAAGIGAGVGVTVLTKDTRAWIGDAFVDAMGNSAEILVGDIDGTAGKRVFDGSLSALGAFGRAASGTNVRGVAVVAQSREDVLAIAIAGAGGFGAGIAGAVTVSVLDSDTRAYIDGGARVNTGSGANANQDVHVQAVNDVAILAVSGAAAGGIAGLAGGVDVGVIHNDTSAFIAGDVRAQRDVRVTALADREIDSFAISIGAGGVGLGAAVTVYSIGGNLVATYEYDDDGTTQSKDSLKDDSTDDPNTDEDESTEKDTDVIASVDVLIQGNGQSDDDTDGASDGLGQIAEPGTDPDGNAAGTTHNSGDVQDAAQSAQTAFNGATPNAGLSGATSAQGATSVGSQTVPRGTSVFIARNADVTAGRDVDLDARERVELTMVGGGLGVGGVGLGAGIAVLTLDEQVTAFVGAGADISAGGNLTIDAALDADPSVLAVTAGFGAIAGVAAAVVVITDTSHVRAYLEDGASATDGVEVLQADAIRLTASRTTDVEAMTVGIGAGGFFGFGAAVVVVKIEGTTQATVGEWAQIGAATGTPTVGDVELDASATATVNPFGDATTMSVALAASFGGAVSAGVVSVTIGEELAGPFVSAVDREGRGDAAPGRGRRQGDVDAQLLYVHGSGGRGSRLIGSGARVDTGLLLSGRKICAAVANDV